MTETDRRPKMLHILAPEREDTPPEAKRILADCTHLCTASEQTHAVLAETHIQHTIMCIDCITKEAP